MADAAHIMTDEKLERMEKRITAIYSEAKIDIQKKADEYFDKFKKDDAEKLELVNAGKMTNDEYKKWRQGKIMYGKRFTAMKEDIAKQLLNVNQTATAYINGNLPEIYALNYNAFKNTANGINGYSFTLIDADTVKYLATTDTSLLPFRKLDPAKDISWNMKKINSQVLQGIIQGESIPKISQRIMNVQTMNKDAAIRSARTIATGAENKGRMDSYRRAEDDGIILEKEWIATGDSRTRDWHAELNGDTKPIDKPFENEFGEIMYPGDPSANGANVYNCRCTLVSNVKGFKNDKIKQQMAEQLEKLTDEEKYQVSRYTGFNATRFNMALGQDKVTDKIINDIETLNSALMKGIVPERIVLFRDTTIKNANIYIPESGDLKELIGKKINNKTFTSTSFNNLNLQGRKVHIKYYVPKGYNGALYIKDLASPKYKSQEEVTFAIGMDWEIVDIEEVNGHINIIANVLKRKKKK